MLTAKSFDSLDDLATYVNTEGILQTQVQMVHRFDGRWYLLWWA